MAGYNIQSSYRRRVCKLVTCYSMSYVACSYVCDLSPYQIA